MFQSGGENGFCCLIYVFERRCCRNEEMVEYVYGARDLNHYAFLSWMRRTIQFQRV